MKILGKIAMVIGFLALVCPYSISQITFNRADSVIDFMSGIWTWEKYCDGWSGCTTEFDSPRLFCFDTVKGSDDSIAFQCIRGDTLFYGWNYKVLYSQHKIFHNDYFWTLQNDMDCWVIDFFNSDSIRMRMPGYDAPDIILSRGGTITGIDFVFAGKMTFYPNPCKDQLVIAMEQEGMDKIWLFNSRGQLVKYFDLRGAIRFSIDVSDLPQGIYMVKAVTGNSIFLGKILKE